MSQMKNTLNGINSLLDFAKQNITINEYTHKQIIPNGTQRKTGVKKKS